MKLLATALLTLALAGAGFAQHSVVFALDSDENTFSNGNGLFESGLLKEDEVAIVTPTVGLYSASAWLTMSCQWAYLGDADNDGRYADDSVEAPGDDTDSVFVKRFPSAPVGPLTQRDLYISKESSDGFAAGTIENGDVFRYIGGPNGTLEVFVREDDLLVAIGQASTSDLNTDAICQSSTGDLFVSFADNELVNGVNANDGSIIMIPASAIAYDGNFNVASITAGSAIKIAEEADMFTVVAASGMKTSVGGTITASNVSELTALEIDPNGGTWTTPLGGQTVPNLLFAWQGFSNDGGIVSTAGGGSIATINGIAMGSTVATTGLQIGMLPTSTGIFGMNGLAVIDAQANPFVSENHPRNLITSLPSYHRVEFSGATPGAIVAVLGDVGPAVSGSALGSLVFPPFGELFITSVEGVNLGSVVADTGGFANMVLILTSPTLVGLNVVFQGFDLSTFTLSAPAALQFL